MFRELIEKEAKKNKHIIPQEGASEKDISKAEKALNVKFPKELKTLLSEMNGDGYLFMSTDKIIESNKTVRKILGEDYMGLNKILFFAGNGCGDYYSYIIDNKKVIEGKIVRWEHETNEIIPVASNLNEVIDKYFSNLI